MSYMLYDIILLVIFAIVISIVLYKKRRNLKREGVLLLYRTSWGMKLIDYLGKKYKKTLDVLSYISVGLGYLLTIGVLWVTYTLVKIYVTRPDVVNIIKVPPIMPLVPYIDKFVNFLPPFYFTYWIVILAVIAITHELAHGIFMRRYDIKVKSTGFGFFPFFFPIFPAAFVEQDEKSMVKAKNFEQRAVLSAGTFANTLTAIVFTGALAIFFVAFFSPAGVVFDDYAFSTVNVSSITMINGVNITNPSIEKISELTENASMNDIVANGKEFAGIRSFPYEGAISLYYDAPAIKNHINGAILEINGKSVKTIQELGEELDKYSPGDTVTIKTKNSTAETTVEVKLGENPSEENSPWLGVVFVQQDNSGLMGTIVAAISSFKHPNTYYVSNIGDFGWFIYYLLWWLILMSISVALINMLPMGIFDGGRFFYLTVLKLTKSEKIAVRAFKAATYLFLGLLLLIMLFWVFALAF